MPILGKGNDAFYVLPSNSEIVEGCRLLTFSFIEFLRKKVRGELEVIKSEGEDGLPYSLKFVVDKGGEVFVGKVHIQRALIHNAVIRVDKRICYFGIFNRIQPNEIKVAALYAYWILKFRPFMVDGSLLLEKELETINERFAFFLILGACKAIASRRKLSAKAISEGLRKEVIYAFQYQDLSKEAVIKIAEMIGEALFGVLLKK